MRPEPGASATLERALALGLDAFKVPLFEVHKLAWQTPNPQVFDALLLTSANASRLGGRQLCELRVLPAYAVGESTAAAAKSAGFAVSAAGNAGVEALLDSIDPAMRLLHLCGRNRIAIEAAQSIVAVPVYESRVIDHVDNLEQFRDCVALVHSPRAARRLAELAPDRGTIAIAAISDAAADAAGPGWMEVEACALPDDDALLELAARLCESEFR